MTQKSAVLSYFAAEAWNQPQVQAQAQAQAHGPLINTRKPNPSIQNIISTRWHYSAGFRDVHKSLQANASSVLKKVTAAYTHDVSSTYSLTTQSLDDVQPYLCNWQRQYINQWH